MEPSYANRTLAENGDVAEQIQAELNASLLKIKLEYLLKEVHCN